MKEAWPKENIPVRPVSTYIPQTETTEISANVNTDKYNSIDVLLRLFLARWTRIFLVDVQAEIQAL
jgi:hypothetical protein